MDQRVYIARLNIAHFRRKLLTEKDGATRRQLVRLLAEEAAKLASLGDPLASDEDKDKSQFHPQSGR